MAKNRGTANPRSSTRKSTSVYARNRNQKKSNDVTDSEADSKRHLTLDSEDDDDKPKPTPKPKKQRNQRKEDSDGDEFISDEFNNEEEEERPPKKRKGNDENESDDDEKSEESETEEEMDSDDEEEGGKKATKGSYHAALQKNPTLLTIDRGVKEFKWQGTEEKKGEERRTWVDQLVSSSTPITLIGIRQDSGTILVIHSIARYAGDPLDPFETHHHKIIGFIGNGGEGAPDPQPILIEEGDLGTWVTKQVDTSNIGYDFCREEGNRYKVYVTPKATKKKKDGENPTLQDASAPLLCLAPTFLVPWLLEKHRTPNELLLKLRGLYRRGKIPADVKNIFLPP